MHLMNKHVVDLAGEEPGEKLVFSSERVEGLCRLTCLVRGETIISEERDFFEALLAIRQRSLEPMGVIPFCYGASLNAWPSGMARDMGSGRFVYLMRLGVPNAGPPVGIFDAGADVAPSLVTAQHEFFQAWVRSIKARTPP